MGPIPTQCVKGQQISRVRTGWSLLVPLRFEGWSVVTTDPLKESRKDALFDPYGVMGGWSEAMGIYGPRIFQNVKRKGIYDIPIHLHTHTYHGLTVSAFRSVPPSHFIHVNLPSNPLQVQPNR